MGELKPGWKRVKFGDVVRQVKDKVDPTTSGIDRYVAGEHMNSDDLRIRRWGEVGDSYLGPAFHMRFRPGHVLYGSRRTYLRKVAVADFTGICANTTFVLETADPAILLPEMVAFVMTTDSFHEHSQRESKGSVNPYVNFSDLAWYEFALPPLEEQHRLASVLQSIRLAKDEIGRTIDACANLAKATIDAGIARLSVAYPEVPAVSVLSRLTVGIVVKPADLYSSDGDAIPALRSLNVNPGRLVMDDVVRITPEGHRSHAKSQLKAGDVVIVRTGRPGEAAVIPRDTGPMNCIDLIVSTPTERLSPEFFALFLNSARTKRLFSAGSTGTAQQHFNVGAFKQLTLPVPPRTVQDELVAVAETLQTAQIDLTRRAESVATLQHRVLHELASHDLH